MDRKPSVLIADDDPQALGILEQLMLGQGYGVLTASDGGTARDRIFAKKPDLVIVDNHMPVLSGIEICREVKAHAETRLIPVVMLTGFTDTPEKIQSLEAGVDDFINKPFKSIELIARVKSLLRMKFINEELDSAEGVIFALARAIEAKDTYTQGHTERVSQLALVLGHHLDLTEEELSALYKGGVLHDIGKIAIPDAILNKPGSLTAEELYTIRTHPDRGESICKPLNSIRSALQVIRSHHEKLDGSGYPDRLQGDQIPKVARVMAIVDVYDALTTTRAYRPAMSRERALAILEEEAERGWWDKSILGEFKKLVVAGK